MNVTTNNYDISNLVALRPLSMNVGLKELTLLGNPVGGYHQRAREGKGRGASSASSFNYASLRPCIISFVPHLLLLDGVRIPPSNAQRRLARRKEEVEKKEEKEREEEEKRKRERRRRERGNETPRRRLLENSVAGPTKTTTKTTTKIHGGGKNWERELKLISTKRRGGGGGGDADDADGGVGGGDQIDVEDMLRTTRKTFVSNIGPGSPVSNYASTATKIRATIDPSVQKKRMAQLSKPVNDNGVRAKRKIDRLQQRHLPGFGGAPIPRGFQPSIPDPVGNFDEDVEIERGTVLNVADILRSTEGPRSPRSSTNHKKSQKNNDMDGDAEGEGEENEEERRRRGKKKKKREISKWDLLSRRGAKPPREKVQDVVLRGHTAVLPGPRGTSGPNLFDVAASSAATIKGIGVSNFTMPGPVNRPAWNSGNGSRANKTPEESVLERQRRRKVVHNARRMRNRATKERGTVGPTTKMR